MKFSLGITLLGGELDACGWALHVNALSIAPCLGVDVDVGMRSIAKAAAQVPRALRARLPELLA